MRRVSNLIAAAAALAAAQSAAMAPTPRPDRAPAPVAAAPFHASAGVVVAAFAPPARPDRGRETARRAAETPVGSAPQAGPAPAPRPLAKSRLMAQFDSYAAAPFAKAEPNADAQARPVPAALSPRARPGLGADMGGEGGLCGDARLIGSLVPTVVGVGGCGIENPVRVSAISGVRLTKPITVGCATARRTADWIDTVAEPAARKHLGARLAALDTFAGYSCRPRNNRPGARMSLHGLGKAVDIGAFLLADGRTVTVKDDWRSKGGPSAFLRAAWRGACGPFGTVLGPGSDGHHEDHLHFDVAERRTPYCR